MADFTRAKQTKTHEPTRIPLKDYADRHISALYRNPAASLWEDIAVDRMSTAALTRCSSTPSTANGNLCRAGLARTPAVAVGARRRQFYLPQTKSTEPHRRPERCSSSRSLTICAVLPNSRNGHAVEKLKLAVLIDGENAQAAVIEPLLAEVAKYGTASVKRIYADWTKLQHRCVYQRYAFPWGVRGSVASSAIAYYLSPAYEAMKPCPCHNITPM